ncbi:trans-2,3-dihydro-3-hydroxyanthranilate isomerase, partial [Phenoliferia sp. Uapishka_3]
MADLTFQVVDAFTRTQFGGNQAAVVIFAPSDPRANSDAYQLSLAKEFNFSETAFLTPLPSSSDSQPHYRLRWFTPVVEFPMCGHATLASAHVLFATRYKGAALIRFETMSGILTAKREFDGLELDFPADAGVLAELAEGDREKLMGALEQMGILELKDSVRGCAKGKIAWVIEVAREVDLKGLKLDVRGFKHLGGYIIFTQASSDPAYDIVSRVLDPVEEIQEDPVVSQAFRALLVAQNASAQNLLIKYFGSLTALARSQTGSAHCMLAPYWLGTSARSRLQPELILDNSEVDTLRARQASARGGNIDVHWVRETGRAKLRGHAVTVMEGVIKT